MQTSALTEIVRDVLEKRPHSDKPLDVWQCSVVWEAMRNMPFTDEWHLTITPTPPVARRPCAKAKPKVRAADAEPLPLGDNVDGGQIVPPIMASLFRLAMLISEKVGASTICWNPARQIIGIDHFRDAVSAYSEGV